MGQLVYHSQNILSRLGRRIGVFFSFASFLFFRGKGEGFAKIFSNVFSRISVFISCCFFGRFHAAILAIPLHPEKSEGLKNISRRQRPIFL